MKNHNILPKFLISVPIVLAGFLYSSFALSFESFVIKNIRLEGLQRFSKETVYSYLPVQVGDTISESRTSDIIRALFKTGFFQDVHLAKEGDILVLQFKERPAIGSFKLSGNKDLPTEMLTKSFKQMGLVEGQTFNRAALEMVRNDLEKVYASRGKYAVKVETKVTPLPRNRVKVEIIIDEGFVARIKQINICGNKAFSKSKLLGQLTLSTPTFWSWYTHDDEFDQEKLAKDLMNLKSFYMDRGYINFKVVSTPIAISPDKHCIFMTINISEGEIYTVKSAKVEGDTAFLGCELNSYLNIIKSGEVFSRSKIIAIAKAMTDLLGNAGYAFAQVDPIPDINETTKELSFVFHVTPGKKVYVRRLDFEGNVKTEDTVLRKQAIQLEGVAISTPKVEATKARYDRTGFFNEVNINTVPVPGIPDQVDVIYSVTEAPTGSLSGGVGYSSEDRLLFNAKASNRNLFGTGKNLDLDFNYSRSALSCNLGYNNPFYTLDGVSRGFGVFYNQTSLGESAPISHYNTDVYGANVSHGIPLTEHQRLTFVAGIQNTKLTFPKDSALPREIKQFLEDNKSNCSTMTLDSNKACNFKELNLALGWTYNDLDRYVFPHKGMAHSLGFNITTPFSDLQYYKVGYNMQYYRPLAYDFIGLLLANVGYGYGYGSTSDLPFFKNYYLGGAKTLRGFEDSSLGPKDSLGKPFGGNLVMNGTVALVLPEFIAPQAHSVRTALFLDWGQVYHTPSLPEEGLSSNANGFRFALGASITWISPIGPLVLNLAYPLNVKKGDQTKLFSVAFGTVF